MNDSPPPRTGPRLMGALLLSATLALAFSACASGSSSDSAHEKTSSSSGSAAGTTSHDWMLALADCVRDQGIEVSDPNEDGALVMQGSQNKSSTSSAFATCEEKLGPGPEPSEAEDKAREAESLELSREAAACFRENGYDMADPSASDPQLHFPSDAPDSVQAECLGGVQEVGPQ
jgi:hypothetical protein